MVHSRHMTVNRLAPDYEPHREAGESWCLGLPFLSRRAPGQEERAEIERSANRLRIAGILLAVPVPFVFLALLAISAIWESSRIGSAVAFGLLLGALPICVAM